jgi:hypothetical protein
LAKRSKTESAKSKVESAGALAGLGGAIGSIFSPVGGAIGASVGGLTGLIIGDKTTVFPIDMVAIPAYQAYLINGTPALTVYIKAGETLVPTGGNVADMTENMDIEAVSVADKPRKTRKASPYNKRYQKFFKEVAPDFKKKNGEWKSNGFKRAVRAAHRLAKGGRV